MRLFLLAALTMTGFAANSVLTRAALQPGAIDPNSFAEIRMWSGAAMLVGLCLLARAKMRLITRPRLFAVPALLIYVIGFTQAYLGMDAGLGALLLFGAVQVTMFGGSVLLREALPALRLVGAAIAFAGLIYLVWPWQAIAQAQINVAMMAMAGVAWGVYSLAGRGSDDALADSAVNFVMAAAGLLVVNVVLAGGDDRYLSGYGIILAIISGAITSGLAYALWFRLLPGLPASVAAVAQLTVPPIAMLGGIVILGEALTIKFALASVVILGGVALSVLGPGVMRFGREADPYDQ